MNRPPRILLVDDEVAIQRAVAPLLRSRGYEVEVVSTGKDAVDAVVDRSPDLIVLDLGLPDLEGTEVCRRIRKESKAPIVILSARGGEADKVAALDIGADDYVTKPFGSEELLARIRVPAWGSKIGFLITKNSSPAVGPWLSGVSILEHDHARVSLPFAANPSCCSCAANPAI